MRMLYNDAMGVIRKTPSIEASAALTTLENYVNGAIIQWERIQTNKKALLKSEQRVDRVLLETVFLDIHFFFICCDKVQNLLELVARTNGDELVRLIDERIPRFKPFNDARNHLEHIETRITRKRFLRDLGNLRGDVFTFGGKEFDVSSSSLAIVTDTYEEVIAILRSRQDSQCAKLATLTMT